MIACKRVKGKRSYDIIRHEYEEAVVSFDTENKISTVIRVNASNMIKSFNLSILVCDKLMKKLIMTVMTMMTRKNRVMKKNDDALNGDLLPEECFPNHLRCYAHTLQLLVKGGLLQCGTHLKKKLLKKSLKQSELCKKVTTC